MTKRERPFFALRKEPVDRIPWVADLQWWHETNRGNAAVPKSYRGLSLLDLRSLMPLIRDTGLDVIEGLAPEPMGDFTLAELRDHLGGRVIMWGGVPPSIFCAGYSRVDVREYVHGLLGTIVPTAGFVLGIGDMLPPDGDIDKIRLISDIVEATGISMGKVGA